MDKRVLLLVGVAVVLLVAAVLIPFNSFNSGNVVLNYQQQHGIGERIDGQFSVGIEQGDNLPADTPISVSLTRGNSVLVSKTITLDDFVNLSGSEVGPINDNGIMYYRTPQVYNVEITKLVDFQFNESGQYDLMFAMPKIDLIRRDSITVN